MSRQVVLDLAASIGCIAWLVLGSLPSSYPGMAEAAVGCFRVVLGHDLQASRQSSLRLFRSRSRSRARERSSMLESGSSLRAL